jgi:Zn-finger nucleic acid-binding protein
MEEMTCPQCQSTMATRYLADVTVHQCTACQGVFLERADLGNLVEAEIDWHRNTGPKTEPLPRITADMTFPPPSRPSARSYIETLFG